MAKKGFYHEQVKWVYYAEKQHIINALNTLYTRSGVQQLSRNTVDAVFDFCVMAYLDDRVVQPIALTACGCSSLNSFESSSGHVRRLQATCLCQFKVLIYEYSDYLYHCKRSVSIVSVEYARNVTIDEISNSSILA